MFSYGALPVAELTLVSICVRACACVYVSVCVCRNALCSTDTFHSSPSTHTHPPPSYRTTRASQCPRTYSSENKHDAPFDSLSLSSSAVVLHSPFLLPLSATDHLFILLLQCVRRDIAFFVLPQCFPIHALYSFLCVKNRLHSSPHRSPIHLTHTHAHVHTPISQM